MTPYDKDMLLAALIAGTGMLLCLSGLSFVVIKTLQFAGIFREESYEA